MSDFGLSILNNYMPTEKCFEFLNNTITHKYKNIWNTIVINWIKMHNAEKNKKEYLSSVYSKQDYNHIHETINQNQLSDLIQIFVADDIFKALFAYNCISKLY